MEIDFYMDSPPTVLVTSDESGDMYVELFDYADRDKLDARVKELEKDGDTRFIVLPTVYQGGGMFQLSVHYHT